MKEIIKKEIELNRKTTESLLSGETVSAIEEAAKMIISSLEKRGKIIVFGNGGSAADSQHMVAEFVGRFRKERKGMPAIALTTNTSSITALSNDYGYDVTFKRQLEALGTEDDVVIGISTSGNAKNVIEALTYAKDNKISSIAITGKDGGKIKSLSDVSIIVRSDNTPNIQEAHILIIHIICGLVEDNFSNE